VKNNSRGFSLIELLIVVAIILIIAAIAIPNFLRARISANQASAVASLRSLNTAEISYSSTYNTGYTATLGYLAPPTAGGSATSTAAGLIDSVLGSGSKSGYNFIYSPALADYTGKINTFGIVAAPISTSTGTNYYYTDQSGVIRQNSTTTASSSDSPISG
jgi:type IV pilus assembly protein PilA